MGVPAAGSSGGHPLTSADQKEDEPPPYESVISESPIGFPAPSGVYGAPTNAEFGIAVTEPVKQGDGVGAFVSYKVVSTVSLEGYRPGRHDVIRRFRDFTWLKNRLRSQYMGVIVPALPEKNVVEKYRMVNEFIEQRRAALAVFMNRVAAHPVLRRSPDLRLFLQANETEFAIEASRAAAEAGDTPPAATSGAAGAARKTLSGAAKLLRSLGQTATAGLGGTGPQSHRSGDEEEGAEYLRMRSYVAELEGHLEQTHRQAASLVHHHANLGAAVAEFGAAMAALGRHEETGAGGEAAQAFAQLGERSAAVAVVGRRSADALAASFEAPLKEIARSVRAAKKAMADRAEALAARQVARAEGEARRARLAKIRSTPGMREERVAEAERDLRAASAKAESTSAAYAAVVERMGGDLGRFQRERAQEMGYILRDFAQAEAAAAGEVSRLWRLLVPALAQADAQ